MNYGLVERNDLIYTYEEMINYSEQFSKHWMIKILLYFSYNYPLYKQKLLSYAFKKSLEFEFTSTCMKIFNDVNFEDQDLKRSSIQKLVYLKEKSSQDIFIHEEKTREAKIIGVPENYRIYLYELFNVYFTYAYYSECIDILERAIKFALPHHLRPHTIFIKLAELYMITDNFVSLMNLIKEYKIQDEPKFNKVNEQTFEKHTIVFLSSITVSHPHSIIFEFLHNNDRLCFDKLEDIIPKTEFIKIFFILLFSAFSFKDILSLFKLITCVPTVVDRMYQITPIIMAIHQSNFNSLYELLYKLFRHIQNDFWLNSISDKIIQNIIQNMSYNILQPYLSMYYKTFFQIIPISKQYLSNLLLDCASENTSNSSLNYTYDIQTDYIYRSDRNFFCSDHDDDIYNYPKQHDCPSHKRKHD